MSSEVNISSNQKVQAELTRLAIESEIIEFSATTRTAQEAAHEIGCTVAEIVKSLIFCTQETHQPILVLASGINRVNEKTIEQYIGEKIKKADADFVRQVTGFAIGGVPPFAHSQKIKTLIDEDLLQYERIWAAAGTPFTVFSLPSSDLARVTGGTIVRIQ